MNRDEAEVTSSRDFHNSQRREPREPQGDESSKARSNMPLCNGERRQAENSEGCSHLVVLTFPTGS